MGPHKGTALDSLQRGFPCFASSQLLLTAASQLPGSLHLPSSGQGVTHHRIPREWRGQNENPGPWLHAQHLRDPENGPEAQSALEKWGQGDTTHTWPAEWPSWGNAVNKVSQTVPRGWQGGLVMPGGKEARKRSIWL